VRYGRKAMRDEIATTCGSVDAARSTHSWIGCASSMCSRCRIPSTGTTIPRSACFRHPARLPGCCGLAPLEDWASRCEAVRRPATPSAVQLPVHVCRLSPDSALALYAVITYMDTIEGVWFPVGGMHAVPTVMAQRNPPLRRPCGNDLAIASGPGNRCPHQIWSADYGRRCGLHS
jgi:phytoene desaturase